MVESKRTQARDGKKIRRDPGGAEGKKGIRRTFRAPAGGQPGGDLDPDTTQSQLLFGVLRDANKVEIRHAVEKLWTVGVVDVRTCIVRGKEKRVGRFVVQTGHWKKAIVTLAAGQNVEFFEGV